MADEPAVTVEEMTTEDQVQIIFNQSVELDHLRGEIVQLKAAHLRAIHAAESAEADRDLLRSECQDAHAALDEALARAEAAEKRLAAVEVEARAGLADDYRNAGWNSLRTILEILAQPADAPEA